MKQFWTNLANMIKVKAVLALAVIAVFVVLALRGDIEPKDVMAIIAPVFAFYFGTQQKKGGGRNA